MNENGGATIDPQQDAPAFDPAAPVEEFDGSKTAARVMGAFGPLLYRFHLTLDSVRELSDSLEPHVEEIEKALAKEWVKGLDESIPHPLRMRALSTMANLMSSEEDAETRLTDDVSRGTREVLRSHIPAGGTWRDINVAGGTWLEDYLGEATLPFLLMYLDLQRTRLAPSKLALLNGSLLTLVVSAFEVLVAGLASQHYRLHPDILDPDRKQFSLGDLKGFDTIRDAEESLIATTVDQLMFGSLDDWSRWFKQQAKAGFDGLCDDYPVVVEAFQRRHVHIHNAGRASASYVANVRGTGVKVGENLRVTRDYLDAAIDRIDVLGTLLTVLVWTKWVPESVDLAGSSLSDRVTLYMGRGKWKVVQPLADYGRNHDFPDSRRFAFMVNHWLAQKRLADTSAISQEVAKWDTSALEVMYKFVRACLLDDLDEAFRLAPDLLKEKFGRSYLRTWPVCKELRNDPRFVQLGLTRSAVETQPGNGESGAGPTVPLAG
jgi:hypothetical protein